MEPTKSLITYRESVNLMEICEKIRSLRKEHDLSQRAMAEKLDMSVNGYSKIERGETELNMQRLKQIAEVFNISPHELIPQGNNNLVCFINHGENYAGNLFSESELGRLKNLEHEIDKLKLVIEHKNEVIARQERELEALHAVVAFLDKRSS